MINCLNLFLFADDFESKSGKKISNLSFTADLLTKMQSYEISDKKAFDKNELKYLSKIYHYPREKTKIFWFLSNQYLNSVIEDCALTINSNKENDNVIKVNTFR